MFSVLLRGHSAIELTDEQNASGNFLNRVVSGAKSCQRISQLQSSLRILPLKVQQNILGTIINNRSFNCSI